MDSGGSYPKRCHFVGLEPDTHRESAIAKDVRALHSADRAQLGLHHTRQVIGDLVLIEIAGGEPDIHRRELIVCSLKIDDGSFRLRRQVVAYLCHLGLDLR